MIAATPGRRGRPGPAQPLDPARRADPAPRRDPGMPHEGGPDHGEPSGGSCLTCADSATTVTVLRLLPDGMALVGAGAGTETVSVALVSASPGDAILVHAGEAIAVVAG